MAEALLHCLFDLRAVANIGKDCSCFNAKLFALGCNVVERTSILAGDQDQVRAFAGVIKRYRLADIAAGA